MSSQYCVKCGNKIPRKYIANGKVKKTPKGKNLCHDCFTKKIPADVSNERHRRKELLVKMLGGKCAVCGYDKSYKALSFHHKDPKTKSFDISHNGNLLQDWDIVVKEVMKCELLCLNCHSEIHN